MFGKPEIDWTAGTRSGFDVPNAAENSQSK